MQIMNNYNALYPLISLHNALYINILSKMLPDIWWASRNSNRASLCSLAALEKNTLIPIQCEYVLISILHFHDFSSMFVIQPARQSEQIMASYQYVCGSPVSMNEQINILAKYSHILLQPLSSQSLSFRSRRCRPHLPCVIYTHTHTPHLVHPSSSC